MRLHEVLRRLIILPETAVQIAIQHVEAALRHIRATAHPDAPSWMVNRVLEVLASGHVISEEVPPLGA